MSKTGVAARHAPHTDPQDGKAVQHRPSASDLNDEGLMRPGILIDLAERVTRDMLRGPLRAVDVKTLYLAPVPADMIVLRPQMLHQTPQMSVCQTRVETLDGQALAIIGLTFERGDNPAPQMTRPSAPEPATGSLRQRRLDALIVAATDVIAAKGFVNATIRDIADAAGVHVPTLYKYVTSKEVLLELIYRREMTKVREEMLAGLDTSQPPDIQLRHLLNNQMRYCAEHRHAIGLLNREFRHLTQLTRRDMAEEYRALITPYETLLNIGMDQGIFHKVDAFTAANFFENAGDIWALRPFFFGQTDFEEYRKNVIEFLMGRLVPKRGQVLIEDDKQL